MTTLFEETAINGMVMSNRMIRSATWEGMCEQDGKPTEKVVNWYRELAKGGIGLIITGYAFVRPEGKQLPGKMGIHTDAVAGDYEKLTDTVHEAGGKVALQIVHAGGETDANTAGRQPLAPSAVKVDQFPEMPVELSKDEISDI
ncbi:MAG: NADH:flavin oxidoreductase, partial [Proteobacteria bacterium]|nr:NADH:flavin oxidoreductase [Pseudomonadota bacterium]